MAQIKQNTKAYFKPQRVKTSPFKLALGSMFMKGVTTSDHKGKVKTTTFTSIAEYLDKFGLLESATVYIAGEKVDALQI